MNNNEILIYKSNELTTSIEVKLEDETIWLTQAQIVRLFDSSKANISEHIKHIFQTGELQKASTVRKIRTVRVEGNREVSRFLIYFNLDIIKSANTSIVLIDNYINENVLLLLSKRKKRVKAAIFTANITKQLKLDIEQFNAQYTHIDVKTFKQSHDRFLIIDSETVYHIGASLKDLGKKWFAFSRININAGEMIKKLK